MRQLFCTLLGVFALVCATHAQNAKGPKMLFDVTTIDYGAVEYGRPQTRKFKVTNVGTELLQIRSCQASCGCMTVKFPTEPIQPGQSSEIEVRYNADRGGPFKKTVTIVTNEQDNPRQILNIKGEVKQ